MSRYQYQSGIYKAVLIRMLIVLLFFTLSRSLFYLFNRDYFGDMAPGSLLIAFLGGVRFDITAIIVLNAPYLLMNVVPFRFRTKALWQGVANMFFYVLNIAGLALNDIDTVYFRFTSKRMTADIFSYLRTGDEDFFSLLPTFIADFWRELLAWGILVSIFVIIASKVKVRKEKYTNPFKFYLRSTAGFLIAGTIAIIGIRGGLQLRPVTIIDAGKYVSAKNVSLVLNTPFTIIKSYGHTGLKEVIYFTDDARLEEIYSPEHSVPQDSTNFKDFNVVLLIMESFGVEYISSLNGIDGSPAYTPHLDSIIEKGLVFKAYANGKQSMEALPAIVAGLPSLTTRPYITSAYGSNQINSLASLLAMHGYSSAFFHGGRNGTMGFESFADIAGFDHYYGKDEYGKDDDFDGNWGIYDEPYFEYFRKNLDTIREPFFMTFFSLSSHHPYTVPEKYKGKFSKGTLDIHESIMYSDYALGRFFNDASSSPWFENTLFVITADHTSLSYEKEYQNREGNYAIPLIFYMPEKISPSMKKDIAQQTDILPSVLGFLGFEKPFVAFGNNLFDTVAPRYAVNHIDGTYQLLMDGWAMLFDGKEVISFKRMARYGGAAGEDAEKLKGEMLTFLKAYIQQYNHRLLNNKLVIRQRYE